MHGIIDGYKAYTANKQTGYNTAIFYNRNKDLVATVKALHFPEGQIDVNEMLKECCDKNGCEIRAGTLELMEQGEEVHLPWMYFGTIGYLAASSYDDFGEFIEALIIVGLRAKGIRYDKPCVFNHR